MAFASIDSGGEGEPSAEINMVPFIDVMLVLLVIFMVTAPLLSHSVKIRLPQASSTVDRQPAEPVRVSIDAAGQVYWGTDPVGADSLRMQMVAAAARDPIPELQIRADRATQYEHVARVMATAARAGLTKRGFVTEPEPAGR